MEPITLIIIAANLVISYYGFRSPAFFEKNLFQVDRVLGNGEYSRLLMSGFLHADWTHLLFNMFSFYSFSVSLEQYLGAVPVAIIYFASLLGGDVLALFIHRHHGQYRAVGASGAVSGIIFAAIAIFPGISVGIFLIPVAIPGWIFGLIYVLYSIYGIRERAGNIGHEAHLGGALIGLATAVILVPEILANNARTVLFIAVPSAIFLLLMIFRPQVLKIQPGATGRTTQLDPDDQYNIRKREGQKELDNILDKIRRTGMESLTPEERKKLEKYSSRDR